MRHLTLLILGVLAVGLIAQSAEAGLFRHGRRGCGDCNDCVSAPCQVAACETQHQTVERTVMVPTVETEMRTVKVTEWQPEQRTRNYTVYRRVPEQRTVEYEYVQQIPEKRTRTVNYTECRQTWQTKEVNYTVQVPYTEQRQATRRVCRMIPVEQTRTVCEDRGHWETVACETGCGGCDNGCNSGCNTGCNTGCGYRTARHWVPNVVTRQVTYTVMKPQVESVPYEYNVTLCRPETRTRTIQVPQIVREQKSREVEYMVAVPQRKTATRQVTEWRSVPEEKTANYTVTVPVTVEKQVPVRVCKMVAKTITCQVPVPAAPSCGGCY